jgi:hypothetical protein
MTGPWWPHTCSHHCRRSPACGAAWRRMSHDLPPWHTGYQQHQRWLQAEVCELSCRICVPGGAWRRAARQRPRPPSATGATCNCRPQAARWRAMMGPNVAGAPQSIWRWTPWASCWLSMCLPPMHRTGDKSRYWPPHGKRARTTRSKERWRTRGRLGSTPPRMPRPSICAWRWTRATCGEKRARAAAPAVGGRVPQLLGSVLSLPGAGR